jgi:thioredoxin-like negative regulator of GroEL
VATVEAEHGLETRSRTDAPRLVFFYSSLSGRCRRVEGFIAQVLQRRQNHDTFVFLRLSQEDYPDLFERFGVDDVPTLMVIEGKTVRGRLEKPRSCRQSERFLAPWLR